MPESFVQATRFVLREGGSARARLEGARRSRIDLIDSLGGTPLEFILHRMLNGTSVRSVWDWSAARAALHAAGRSWWRSSRWA
jgi:hypothetical protein